MGQCAGGSARTPSALQCCQAYEQQSSEDSAQTTTGSGARADLPRQDEGISIWHHLARDEVRALGEIVSSWAQRQIDGAAARRQLQLRVLRGQSAASVSLQNHSTSMASIPEGVRTSQASPSLRPRPAEESAGGAQRASGTSRGAGPEPLGGSFAGGLFAGLAAALAGGHHLGTDHPTHEVFSMIDAVFLCRAFEDARVLAMEELGLEGSRALPAEVRSSFHRKAKVILQASAQQPRTLGPWLDLIRLCICVELVRHLKAGRTGAGAAVDPGHSLAMGLVRPDLSPFAAALAMPQQPPLLAVSSLGRGRPDAPLVRPGVDIIFVTGLPQHGSAGISGITFARANISGGDGGAFRMDPDFLRERVGLLLEAMLGDSDHFSRNRGLTAEEIDRSCPLGPRAPAEGGCCPVCLEPTVEGEPVRKLPCNHELHKECVEAWLTTADTCPTCRYQIPRGRQSASRRPQ